MLLAKLKRAWRQWQAARYGKWYAEQRSLIDTIRKSFINHLLAKEPDIIEAIAKQSRVMGENRRAVIAIFISEAAYVNILRKIVEPSEKVSETVNVIKLLQEPVGYLGALPIYLSGLLSKAPIFVVGEISWQLRSDRESRESRVNGDTGE